MVRIYRLEPFFKSPGELSSGCYADLLLQGHVTETEEILRARYVDHDTHLYVDPPSSSFSLLSHPSRPLCKCLDAPIPTHRTPSSAARSCLLHIFLYNALRPRPLLFKDRP